MTILPGGVQKMAVWCCYPDRDQNDQLFSLESEPEEEEVQRGYRILPEVREWTAKIPIRTHVYVQNLSPFPMEFDVDQKLGCIYPVSPVGATPQVKAAAAHERIVDLDFNFGESTLSTEWKKRLTTQLMQRRHVFSTSEMDVGCSRSAQHTIRMSDATPFRERSRRLAPRDVDDVRNAIQDMETAGIVTESRGPYASPIVVVRKKNGSVRLCIDYRTLNNRTIPDQYNLPRIEEILNALNGSHWFSVLDLRSGYYQVPMTAEDQEKTAFVCPLGFYQFTRMPQGICGAPATFQRLMEKTIGDMIPRECLVYLDDIIVFGRTLEEHEERLFKVIDRLGNEGLKLSLDKCRFCHTSVTYVGHIVSAKGIATDPAKVEAVVNWPRPENVTELRSFLGFCGYYRRFVEGYSSKAKPLNNLLKIYPSETGKKAVPARQPFGDKWTSECEQAFLKLKKCLTEAPVLAYADPEQPYVLHVDASLNGLGAVLHQKHPEGLRPVAYISRSLTPSEQRYPVHKLEFLALKWAITEKLHDYLYGVTFEVRTDNNPLTYINTSAKLDAAGHRWQAALSNYSFSLKYKPGPLNIGADALSRRPGLLATPDDEEWEELPGPGVRAMCKTAAIVNDQVAFSELRVIDSLGCQSQAVPAAYCDPKGMHLTHDKVFRWKDLVDYQIRDPVTSIIRHAVEKRNPALLKRAPNDLVALLMREWDKFEVDNCLLYRVVQYHNHPDRRQLVLPKNLQYLVLKSLHDEHGHLGVEKTFGLVRDRFFWPKMREAVEQHCRRCSRCIQRKTLPTRAAPMAHLKSSGPMDLVCMDFLCIEPDSRGIGNVLVITDHYTRYAQAFPTKDQKAITVAKVLWEKFFVHYGLPNRLHSDQGRDFESTLIRELLKMLNVAKSRTTPYHPEGDALPERFNRTLLDMLGTLKGTQKAEWSRHVETLVHAYNCTRHESTGFSPYFLMFGREARLPVDVRLRVSTDGIHNATHFQYVQRLKDSLQQAYQQAEKSTAKLNAGNKRRYDNKVKYRELRPGDAVLLRNLGVPGKHKLADRWRDGVAPASESVDEVEESMQSGKVYEWAMRLEVPPTHTLAVCCIPIDVPSMAIRVALRQHSHLWGTNALALVDQCTETKGYYSVLVDIGQDVNEEQGPSSVCFDGPAESSCAVVYPARPIKSEPDSSRMNLEEVDMCASSSSPESYCESTEGAATDHSPLPSTAPAPTSGGNEIQMLVQSLAELGGARAEASMQQQFRKLKIFSGTKPTPAGEEAFDTWIEYTSQVVEEWTCPELVKRQHIMECLRSPASITIRLAKDQHADITAQKMLETLERAYVQTEDEGQLMLRYLKLRQKLGEELSAYLHRIRKVLWDMRKRDQIKSTQVDEYCWNQFQKGALPDNPIAIMVKCSLMRNDPPCWEDLVDEIRYPEGELEHSYKKMLESVSQNERFIMHEAYGRLHTPAKAKNPATTEEEVAPKGSGHKARPTRNSPPPYRGRSESRDLLCYTCARTMVCRAQAAGPDVETPQGNPNAPADTEAGVEAPNRGAYSQVGPAAIVPVLVEGIYASALLDTGSQVTIIYQPFYEQHLRHCTLRTAEHMTVRGLSNEDYPIAGIVQVQMEILQLNTGNRHPMQLAALVCPEPQGQCKYLIILGTNADIVQAVFRAYLKETNELPLATALLDPVLREECQRIYALERHGDLYNRQAGLTTILPGGVQRLPVWCCYPERDRDDQLFSLESTPEEEGQRGYKILPEVREWTTRIPRRTHVYVQNISPFPMELDAGQKLGGIYPFSPVVDTPEVKAAAADERFVELDFNFGDSTLSTHWKEWLATQLTQRRHVFSMSEMDVGCSCSAQHTIRLSDTTPFRERSRRLAPRNIDDVRNALRDMEDAGTLEEHEERLFKVIDRLGNEGLKLSLDKCRFCHTSVTYVGHIVSAKGIATNPAKVEAVVSWPCPENVTELRSFLGFCGYYRRFVEGYSSKAKPLNNLLKIYPSETGKKAVSARQPFGDKWTSECEQAFLKLKRCLTEAPVLAYADPEQPYVLHVDASHNGLGAVLHQKHPEGLRPVAYISRSLTPSEQRYPVHKLEFLALKWAITEKLHDYLYGVDFEVRTDNNPLTYVNTSAKLDAAGHRWLAALNRYRFSMKYKPGPLNIGADALSRRPGAESQKLGSNGYKAMGYARFILFYLQERKKQTEIILN
ncbi:uncharacterized protein LOC142492246 [Ascaphus truei]|uniref:uncharacterized protein LOC142492246 n=1 Tax=Ascaphus truei TaxID=8439 RepID=UPI003F59457F